MRLIVYIIFLLAFQPVFSQEDYYDEYDYSDSYPYDESDYIRKYPYVRGYTPDFLGLVAGYSFLKAQEVEVGLTLNLVDGPTKYGMTGGYQLVYKRSIERAQNAVDFEMGIYGILTMGMGVNYNFSTDGSAFGFKPFIGTSIYHFQLLYSYNFLRKEKQEWYQLQRHGLTIRYQIPLKARRETNFYLSPAPTYNYLRGLHKNHPVKNSNYQENRLNRW